MLWTLHLQPEVRLVSFGGPSIELERKSAALLAYLALEGSTGRSRMAGLLWPEVPEKRARANLRQTLSRLRNLAGGALVEAGDPLRLSQEADVDVHHPSSLASSQPPAPSPMAGTILAGFDYSDCPDLSDWIALVSERLRLQRLTALEAECERFESEGELRTALERATRIVALDPLSERAHRRLIRLHYLLGDRGAALLAYQQCVKLLRDQLDVEPLPETRELARLLERSALPAAQARPPPVIPLAVLRPPRLVGREREWARMEAAWRSGRIIFLGGAAGIGKSRLAHDFATSKEAPVLLVSSRPGDASVPFASQARAVREVLSAWPSLELPSWVRRELSRMLPELDVDGGAALPPLEEEQARLHFFHAQVELLRALGSSGVTLLVDDLQFCDPASGEVGSYMFSHSPFSEQGASVRTIITFRPDELPEPLVESRRQLIAAGLAEFVELGALEPPGVAELLQELEIPGLQQLDDALSSVAGGNPAILLELVKNLVQSGALEPGRSEPPSLPCETGALLRVRLQRLSGAAGRLAQVAAVAGPLFAPELAAAVLETHPLDLAEPWRELEEAQILRQNRLVHDLLREAVLADLPSALVSHLHRRVALFLEQTRADPTSIALHWQGAGEPARAAPHLLLKR